MQEPHKLAPGHCCLTRALSSAQGWTCHRLVEKEGKGEYDDHGFHQQVDEINDEGVWKDRKGFPVPMPYIEYSDSFVTDFDIIGE